MTGTRQWNTGIMARGRIYFGADNKIYAFKVPTATPTPTPTATATARHAWTDSAQSAGEKGGGNKYIASQMEAGDLGQRGRLPRWSCDRDNAERWFV